MKQKKIVLLLGSNMGNSLQHLLTAKQHLQSKTESHILSSSIYKTQAWGNTQQADFLNIVLVFKSNIPAKDILNICLDIEKKMGRTRTNKWAERIIDIDILFYDNEIIDEQNLKIPHPYLHVRLFTLEPLNELLPNFIHPIFNNTIAQLLANCSDASKVEKL